MNYDKKSRVQIINELIELREKLAELENRKTEKKYHALMEHVPVGTYKTTPEGEIIEANEALAQIFGYNSVEELKKINAKDLYIVKSDRSKYMEKRNTHIPQFSEYQLKYVNGKTIWIQDYTKAIIGKDGNIEYYDGLLIDLTEQKEAVEAIRRSEERYRAVAETAVAGISITNPEEDLIFVNNAFAEMLNYSTEELTGMNLSQLTSEVEFEKFESQTQRRKTGKSDTYESSLQQKNGKTIYVLINSSPLTTSDGSYEATLAVITNITEIKEAERRIAAINLCLSGLGTNYLQNVDKIVTTAGEILQADITLYNRLKGDKLHSLGSWNLPENDESVVKMEGNISYDFINDFDQEIKILQDLQDSPYAHSDPDIKKHKFQTYIGHLIRLNCKPVGTLCAFYRNKYEPSEGKLQGLGTLAGALSNEEKRYSAESALRKSEDQMRSVVVGTASVTGEDFFRSLVWHLSVALDMKCGFIGELINDGKSIDRIVFWDKDDFAQIAECEIKNTPFEKVFGEDEYFVSEGLCKTFPKQTLFKETAFWGLPLDDSAGNNIGIIAVLNDEPIEKNYGAERILKIFAARAGAELERKRTAEALERSENKFRSLAESASDGILSTDMSGNVISWNRAAEKIFGYKNDEIIGKHYTILLPERIREEVREGLSRVIKSGKSKTSGRSIELIGIRKNGMEFPGEVSFSSWKIGKARYFSVIARDITVRKEVENIIIKRDRELEQKNVELEKLDRLKSEMVAITSHDLKAPLHAIIGYADILKTSVQKSSVNTKHINRILKNSHDMVNLIREILNLDKIESGKYRINTSLLKVDDVLKSCIDTNSVAGRERGITIKFEVIGETKPFFADKIKLEQLFNNIISNAVKFSPENSGIQVIYKTIRDEKVEITVCDNGPGIPDKDIAAIFDRYYQADSGNAKTKRGHGTGLGLYISKEIVKLHSGKISIVNRKEGGCCFRIQIPCER